MWHAEVLGVAKSHGRFASVLDPSGSSIQFNVYTHAIETFLALRRFIRRLLFAIRVFNGRAKHGQKRVFVSKCNQGERNVVYTLNKQLEELLIELCVLQGVFLTQTGVISWMGLARLRVQPLLGACPDDIFQLGTEPQEDKKMPEPGVDKHLLRVLAHSCQINAVLCVGLCQAADIGAGEDLDGWLGAGHDIPAYLLNLLAVGGCELANQIENLSNLALHYVVSIVHLNCPFITIVPAGAQMALEMACTDNIIRFDLGIRVEILGSDHTWRLRQRRSRVLTFLVNTAIFFYPKKSHVTGLKPPKP